jgi:hypothetical protein
MFSIFDMNIAIFLVKSFANHYFRRLGNYGRAATTPSSRRTHDVLGTSSVAHEGHRYSVLF